MYYVVECGKKNVGSLGSAFEAPGGGLVGVLAADSVPSSVENGSVSASLSEDEDTRNTARPLI